MEWSRFFIDELGRGARDSEGGPAPTIREDTVLIYPKRDALAGWVEGIDDLLIRANKEYEDTVLSKLDDERRQRVVAQERAESQMEQARKEAEAIEEHPSRPGD